MIHENTTHERLERGVVPEFKSDFYDFFFYNIMLWCDNLGRL